MKNCLLKAGVENTAIVFLFNDTQVSQDFQFWVAGYFRFCVCVCVCWGGGGGGGQVGADCPAM